MAVGEILNSKIWHPLERDQLKEIVQAILSFTQQNCKIFYMLSVDWHQHTEHITNGSFFGQKPFPSLPHWHVIAAETTGPLFTKLCTLSDKWHCPFYNQSKSGNSVGHTIRDITKWATFFPGHKKCIEFSCSLNCQEELHTNTCQSRYDLCKIY